MKGTERELYKTLIELPKEGYGLCNICRYAEWAGCSCEDADIECHCGIYTIEEESYDVWEGRDCWAFRPRYSLDDTVDMVGVFLQGDTPDMSDCKDLMPQKMRVERKV